MKAATKHLYQEAYEVMCELSTPHNQHHTSRWYRRAEELVAELRGHSGEGAELRRQLHDRIRLIDGEGW